MGEKLYTLIADVHLRAVVRGEVRDTIGGAFYVSRGRRCYDMVDLELAVPPGKGEEILRAASAERLAVVILNGGDDG